MDDEQPMRAVTSKKQLSGIGAGSAGAAAAPPKAAARGYVDLGAVEPEAAPDSDDDDVRASAVLAGTPSVDPMQSRLNEYASTLKAAGKTRVSTHRPTTVVMSRASDDMIAVDHTNEDGREALPNAFAPSVPADAAPTGAAATSPAKLASEDGDAQVATQRSTVSQRQASSPVMQTRSVDFSTYDAPPLANSALSSGVITTLSPSTGGAVSPPDMGPPSLTPAGTGAGPASPTGAGDADEIPEF